MDDNPIIGFDTSAINELADDPDCAALLPKIRTSFHARNCLVQGRRECITRTSSSASAIDTRRPL